MEAKEVLIKIGLSENEAEIYLTLLRAGTLSANEIAQKTGIYRPHVYDKIETLAGKGLVGFVQNGKRKIFTAAAPEKIQEYLGEKEEELKAQMRLLLDSKNSLNRLQNNSQEDTKVSVYVGPEGLKTMLNDTTRSADKEVLIFGLDDEKYHKLLPIFMPQHFKRLKELGIHERVIVPKKGSKFMFSNSITSYRFLETKEVNLANTIIYGNKVAMVVWGTPITSIIIENMQTANTYREHFEYLWKSAKTRNK